MPEGDFHDIADKSLEEINDLLSILESSESIDVDDLEITLSQGVFKLDLGKKTGTWVLNKQTPNRQIWWSSPISGPKRYEYSDKVMMNHWNATFQSILASGTITHASKWINTKDGLPLIPLLRDEIKKVSGVDIANRSV